MHIFLKAILLFELINPLSTSAQHKVGAEISSQTITQKGIASFFTQSEISDATFLRMKRGGSFPEHCTISRSDLRYLQVLHTDFNGNTRVGELVCNKLIADDLLAIFRKLYEAKYPIESIRLIDDFNADDQQSMSANNTSAFCFRQITGSKRLSKHAQGVAVDINPLYNPAVKHASDGKITSIEPDTPEARKNAKRSAKSKYQITTSDLAYRLFRQHGFAWGGSWRTKKDYQHFEKHVVAK